MTNGEKLKEIFPNGVLTSGGNNSYYWGDDILVSKEWWNAEYKESTIQMTVEEAKKEVKNYISFNGIGFPSVKEAIKILLARLDELEQDLVIRDNGVKDELNRVKNELEPTTKNDLGVDCISRADLYNRIKGIDHYEETEGTESDGSLIAYHTCDWNEVLREIEDAPSVIPQQRIGKWIKSRDGYGNNHYTCPFCEHDIATKYDGTWEDNYCSNCGADMRGEEV